jgi:tripartite-type tricarboxylate transporter receptor subunit TctC
MLGDSGAMAINVALNPRLTYHPLKDFTLITALAAVPTVLVAPSSLPASTLQEFVALAKSKPGELAYGSAGNGSVHHLTMAVFAARAGINLLHVPYKGGSALVAATLTGEVQAGWSGIPNVAPHIRSGKLKVFAISTAARSATLPDVPTAVEAGFPGFDIATVIGLQAPAGMPREITARLQAAVAKALREPDMAARMSNLAMDLREAGTEHYARFVKEDLERYTTAVKAAGLKHD